MTLKYTYHELIEDKTPHSWESYDFLCKKANQSCQTGDLATLKSILLCDDVDINLEKAPEFLLSACQFDQVEVVKFLLTSSELKSHCHIHWNGEEPLQKSCSHGSLSVVKFLLSSPDIVEHSLFKKDTTSLFNPFVVACVNGHLPVVQYLLTSPEVGDFFLFKSMIGFLSNSWNKIFNSLDIVPKGLNLSKKKILECAIQAANNERLDVFKYLTSLPQLTVEHFSAHDNIFFRKCCRKINPDIINFMIEKLEIRLDENSWQALYQDFGHTKSAPDWSHVAMQVQCIEKFFKANDFFHSLEDSLTSTSNEIKRTKL